MYIYIYIYAYTCKGSAGEGRADRARRRHGLLCRGFAAVRGGPRLRGGKSLVAEPCKLKIQHSFHVPAVFPRRCLYLLFERPQGPLLRTDRRISKAHVMPRCDMMAWIGICLTTTGTPICATTLLLRLVGELQNSASRSHGDAEERRAPGGRR